DDPAADNSLFALYPICMKPSVAETVTGHITPPDPASCLRIMITKWPYTMKIKPNMRRKYSQNLYWLRKEMSKREEKRKDSKEEKS
ncbi:MAG TPA: hypothetical protein DDZ21_08765, partial [Gammaproteobacteria bacterium]|nr:hypothetical protein [Gammaproteobacteria bacterium]